MADRLGALERARGEFVAKVSHDLRTPVTVIKGYAFTLARRGGDADTLRRLSAINREADRLTRLIDDLLTLSRAQAGALDLVWHPSARANCSPRSPSGSAARPPSRRGSSWSGVRRFAVDGDRGRLGQVSPTSRSTRSARHRPGSTVTLRADRRRRRRRAARLATAARGIAPDRLPALLEPFATGDPTTGTGLGLAIVAEIVGRARRRLHARAAPGGGTVAAHPPAGRGGSAGRSTHEPPGAPRRRRRARRRRPRRSRCGRPTRAGQRHAASRVLVARRTLPAGRPSTPAQVASSACRRRSSRARRSARPTRSRSGSPPSRSRRAPDRRRRCCDAARARPRSAAGERAVGVRVDDVTGLPALLDAGSEVDLVIGIRRSADRRRRRRCARDGRGGPSDGAWAVALRLPARARRDRRRRPDRRRRRTPAGAR